MKIPSLKVEHGKLVGKAAFNAAAFWPESMKATKYKLDDPSLGNGGSGRLTVEINIVKGGQKRGSNGSAKGSKKKGGGPRSGDSGGSGGSINAISDEVGIGSSPPR